jgi:hypothetical protein
MSSLYSFYLEERENVKTVEGTDGFITYYINQDVIWIKDLYIIPTKRLSGAGTMLADFVKSIGLEKKCKWMRCTVCTQALNATTSMKAILAYGFKLKASDANLIYFEKDL